MMHEDCVHGDQEVLGEVTVALTRVAFETEKCMYVFKLYSGSERWGWVRGE